MPSESIRRWVAVEAYALQLIDFGGAGSSGNRGNQIGEVSASAPSTYLV
jgi:hypothetical protein